jgi:hypothetical protein
MAATSPPPRRPAQCRLTNIIYNNQMLNQLSSDGTALA